MKEKPAQNVHRVLNGKFAPPSVISVISFYSDALNDDKKLISTHSQNRNKKQIQAIEED